MTNIVQIRASYRSTSISAPLKLVLAQNVCPAIVQDTVSGFRDNELSCGTVNRMKYSSIAAPLLASDALHAQMRRAGKHLVDALAEEESRYQEALGHKNIRLWKESRKAVERWAVDYIAMIKLYLEAIGTVFPKSLN